MVRIIKAAMGYAAIPAGFPILLSERMAIIEPAFGWLMELATISGPLACGGNDTDLLRAPA